MALLVKCKHLSLTPFNLVFSLTIKTFNKNFHIISSAGADTSSTMTYLKFCQDSDLCEMYIDMVTIPATKNKDMFLSMQKRFMDRALDYSRQMWRRIMMRVVMKTRMMRVWRG